MLATGTTFVTIELPLWPAHLRVASGCSVTTLLMLIDLPRGAAGPVEPLLDELAPWSTCRSW